MIEIEQRYACMHACIYMQRNVYCFNLIYHLAMITDFLFLSPLFLIQLASHTLFSTCSTTEENTKGKSEFPLDSKIHFPAQSQISAFHSTKSIFTWKGNQYLLNMSHPGQEPLDFCLIQSLPILGDGLVGKLKFKEVEGDHLLVNFSALTSK